MAGACEPGIWDHGVCFESYVVQPVEQLEFYRVAVTKECLLFHVDMFATTLPSRPMFVVPHRQVGKIVLRTQDEDALLARFHSTGHHAEAVEAEPVRRLSRYGAL